MRKHGTGLHRLIRGGKRSRSSPHHARARNPKPLVLAAFFGYFLSLVTESTPAGGIYRHKGCAGRNPSATAFLWPWGRELRIATGTSCPRNDRGFVRGAVGSLRCVGEGLRPSRGRPQGSPLRRGYKEYRGRGDVGIAPYGNACRGGRPCPPGPDNATPCRAGPVCPAGSAGKESPSHGFAVTAPFRQGGLEGRGGGLPRALRALAMTGVFARSAGALLMVRWVGNRKGRPSGKYG